MTGRVGRSAFLLGLSGLLPQVAALGLTVRGGRAATLGFGIAALYGAVILSFLGGIWWGIAMRRERDQGFLVAASVVPSLVAAAALGRAMLAGGSAPLLVLGIAIIMTLFVDRHLVATGEAPVGWMRLRIPLSVGLGGLTIATALVT